MGRKMFAFRPWPIGIIWSSPALIGFDGVLDLTTSLLCPLLRGVSDIFRLIGGFSRAFLRGAANVFGLICGLARAMFGRVAYIFSLVSHLDQRFGCGVHRLLNPARILQLFLLTVGAVCDAGGARPVRRRFTRDPQQTTALERAIFGLGT